MHIQLAKCCSYTSSNQRVTGIPVPGNSRENQLHFFPLDLEKLNSISRLATRDVEKKFPFSSRKMRFLFKFLEKKGHNILRNFEKMTAFFLKISVIKQEINVILENSREICLNLDSRSRLETR